MKLDIIGTKWNNPLHYEPVGCTVLVIKLNNEIVRAYRKSHSSNRSKQGDYFHRDESGQELPVGEILAWTYP